MSAIRQFEPWQSLGEWLRQRFPSATSDDAVEAMAIGIGIADGERQRISALVRLISDRILETDEPPVNAIAIEPPLPGMHVRNVASGAIYEVIAIARSPDGAEQHVIHRSVAPVSSDHHGLITWTLPLAKFSDGRFEYVAYPPPLPPDDFE